VLCRGEKNVTLFRGRRAWLFSDAVTERGVSISMSLAKMRRSGYRAVMFFCAEPYRHRFCLRPRRHIDEKYAKAFEEVIARGLRCCL